MEKSYYNRLKILLKLVTNINCGRDNFLTIHLGFENRAREMRRWGDGAMGRTFKLLYLLTNS
jgi:hypothetical protein